MRLPLATLCALLLPLAAQAHHGLDFLLLQDTSVPAPLHGAFFDNSEWSRERSADEYATEPGLYLGVAPGIGLGVTSHFADMGDGWAYSATTPFAVINLLPPDIKGIRVALWAGYEFAAEEEAPHSVASSGSSRSAAKKRQAAKSSAGAATTSTKSSKTTPPPSKSPIKRPGVARHETTGGSCDPNAGPDAPPCPDGHTHTAAPAPSRDTEETETVAEPLPVLATTPTHEHRGIHRHGESGLHSRLIIEADLSSRDKLVANLINFTPKEGRGAWGYGVGLRHAFTHDFAMSVEAVGDFDAALEHQVMVAAHVSPVHWITIKVGVGVGITPDASDVAVHTGLVWRF